jgi:CheY-like chemotaxis protein
MQPLTNVLVVDDSPFAARALVHVIESRGIRARAASSMEEATRLCTEHRPSLLVTDVCMPNIDLLTLCRHFRAVAAGERGAVLLFSAHPEKEIADVIAAVGADAFMEKHHGAAAVAGKVESLLADVARRQPRPRMPSVPG